MSGFTVLSAVYLLSFFAFHLSSAQDSFDCGFNEMEVQCINLCNTCLDWNKVCITKQCIPGCDCIPGFSRDSSGVCVPTEFCSRVGSTKVRRAVGGLPLLQIRGGCPNELMCRLSCNQRRFKDGQCGGPKIEYCTCSSLLSSVKVPSGGSSIPLGGAPGASPIPLAGASGLPALPFGNFR